ncbi:hypothetical protein EJ02DRAFT_515445 [Clathrospora elynae]|uniref:Uncharacterized protein n=1 Tax=Clathrospora elynae TaxID=706981 RepID=A0A6A5S8W6_9PLEO|nr:hypothetical protein EJ02DRAFT_515445 [Clathrospora elynae]
MPRNKTSRSEQGLVYMESTKPGSPMDGLEIDSDSRSLYDDVSSPASPLPYPPLLRLTSTNPQTSTQTPQNVFVYTKTKSNAPTSHDPKPPLRLAKAHLPPTPPRTQPQMRPHCLNARSATLSAKPNIAPSLATHRRWARKRGHRQCQLAGCATVASTGLADRIGRRDIQITSRGGGEE